MFRVYLGPLWLCFFSKLKIKILTSSNQWVSSSSKSLTLSNKLECCLNHLKIQTKLSRVYNPKPSLQYTCSLVCDVISFICDLKLFKATNRNSFDVTDSLITIFRSIAYVRTEESIAYSSLDQMQKPGELLNLLKINKDSSFSHERAVRSLDEA